MGLILEGLWLDLEVFQEGLAGFWKFSKRVSARFCSFPIGFGLRFWRVRGSFSIYFGCLGGSGWLLGGSWSRLGAVLGPKMDPVTPKFPPKPNPIGVLGRPEGSSERPRNVLGAS